MRTQIVCGALAAWLGLAGVSAAQDASGTTKAPKVEAAFGRGVTITSTDETFSLTIRGRIQVRGTGVLPEDDDAASTTEITIRRARLVFQGNALGPKLTYNIQLGFSNLDQEPDLRMPLRDAYLTWAAGPLANIRFGQMKVPFGRQRVTSSSALQFVDRSIVVAELNMDRDVGITMFSRNLFGSNGKVGYNVGLFSGEGRNRLGRTAGMLYVARFEALPLGTFDDGVESDLQRTKEMRIAVGGGVAYNQNTNRARSTFGDVFAAGDFNYTHAGVDVVLKRNGTSVVGEVIYRRADEDAASVLVQGRPGTIYSRSGWGGYIQAGHLITNRAEITGRFSRLMPRDGTDPTLLRTTEAGGGLGYYLRQHNLKVQGDYFILTAAGDRSHQVRVQTQIYF